MTTSAQVKNSPDALEMGCLYMSVSAIANDPNGHASLRAVAFEDGKKKIKAAISFNTLEAREAQVQIENQRLMLEGSASADHQRVLMVFKQSNVKDAAMGNEPESG